MVFGGSWWVLVEFWLPLAVFGGSLVVLVVLGSTLQFLEVLSGS